MSIKIQCNADRLKLYIAKRRASNAQAWLRYTDENDAKDIASLLSSEPARSEDTYLANELEMNPTFPLNGDEYFGLPKPGAHEIHSIRSIKR